jgi:hypothetical protein
MEKSNGATTVSPFKGKVVLVYLMQSHDAFSGGIAVKDPKIEQLQGLTFLRGNVPDGYDWTSGLSISIRFDQIAHFIEFRTEQEFAEKSSIAMDSSGNA